MSERRPLRPLAVTMQGALTEAWSNRSGFWTQVLSMVVNDVVWIGFWLLFFHQVGTVRGWDSSSILLLFAVLTTAGGITLGFFSNARRVGRLAIDGELDALLTLPVPPLAYLLVRRVDSTNIGDLVFGLVLFAVAGSPTPERIALFAAGVVASTALMTGFLVVVGSLAFFGGRSESGDLGFHAILLLSSYPADIFTGATRTLLYTAVPAAFVATVPSRLISSFDAGRAVALLVAAAVFAFGGWALFTLGLRRYASGSVWTRA